MSGDAVCGDASDEDDDDDEDSEGESVSGVYERFGLKSELMLSLSNKLEYRCSCVVKRRDRF